MEGGLQQKQTALVVRRYPPQRIRNKNGYGKPRRMRPDYKPKILLKLEGNWISGHKSPARCLLDQTPKAPRVLRGAFQYMAFFFEILVAGAGFEPAAFRL